ncbi:MAG: DUF1622 domain-containing protein [Alphaproteobacteria bacterium]|nr:DUF1622 domain-containing protein [Alphaproteobacteria bacterium]
MTNKITFSLADHIGGLAVGLEWLVVLIEILAIAILLLGMIRFSTRFVTGEAMEAKAHERSHHLNCGRLELGRHILAGLEVLIVADLIRTVLHMSFGNLLLLGGLVLIRSFISFFLEHELRSLEDR